MNSAQHVQPAQPPQDLEEFLGRVEQFHGHISPGLVLGGFLTQAAWRVLGPREYLNAVAETMVCLPDAVQVMTGCTLGNGFLQVLDWGIFAVTLYDRQSLRGARAWVLRREVAANPVVAAWFMRQPLAKPVDKEVVVGELLARGEGLVRVAAVSLPQALKPTAKVATRECAGCGESYPERFGDLCPACAGQAYYRKPA